MNVIERFNLISFFRKVAVILILGISLFSFQNCTRAIFHGSTDEITEASESGPIANSGSGGNGGTYDGKLVFISAAPGHTCEGKPSPKSILRRDENLVWTYTVNDIGKCLAINNQVVSDVTYTVGASIIKYLGVDFYTIPTAAVNSASMAEGIAEFKIDLLAVPESVDALIGDGICANANGLCSLQSALDEIGFNPEKPRIINVPAGTFNLAKTFAVATKSVVIISGQGPGTTIFNGSGTSGAFATGFNALQSTLVLQNFSSINASTQAGFSGSGVTLYASVHVKNVIFENHLTSFGPVIYAGVNAHDLLVENTRILNNANSGIGIFAPRSVTVVNSEISGNPGWGINVNNGSWNIRIFSTSIINNGYGVQFRKCYSNCGIDNTTISGNTNSGLQIDCPLGTNIQDIYVRNSTIANNALSAGNNLSLTCGSGPNTRLKLENTIVAKGSSTRPNCGYGPENSTFSVLGFNSMVDDFTCGSLGLTWADALLLPLANNGGFSRTHKLSSASPAIDTGSNVLCLPVDQRGLARPVQKSAIDAVCDMGAVEMQSTE